MKANKQSLKWMFSLVFVFVVYLCIDYFNIPSLVGFQQSNINVDILGILLNSLIVVILYIISYIYIESRQNKKDDNASNAVKTLLKNTYTQCQKNLDFMDNKSIMMNLIIPEVKQKGSTDKVESVNLLKTEPFCSFDRMMDLVSNGYVTESQFAQYLEIKKEYEFLVEIKVTCYVALVNGDTDVVNGINKIEESLKEKISSVYTGYN